MPVIGSDSEILKQYLGSNNQGKIYFGSDLVQSGTFQYVNATGGTITYDGNYKIHTFTEDGTFEITQLSTDGYNGIDQILVVAGGGKGGAEGSISGLGPYTGGGGGAGGLIHITSSDNYALSIGTYDISVGAGGTDAASTGSNSHLTGSGVNLTALGGGGAGNAINKVPQAGGSGGGQTGGKQVASCGVAAPGANGIQPDQSGDSGTYGFGNDGGAATNCQTQGSAPFSSHYMTGGGGGGAGSAGSGTTGGSGKTINITGTNVTYAAGGNAADDSTKTGYGDGGNGASATSGKNGNAGIVIIRYQYKD